MEKITNIRQFEKVLKFNGYYEDHCTGGHRIWTRKLSINAKKPNIMVMKRLIKEYELLTNTHGQARGVV